MRFLKEDIETQLKSKRLKEYNTLAEVWEDSTPSYTYTEISNELFKRYGSRDLKYYLIGVLEHIVPDYIEEDGKKLIELANYIRNFRGE